MGCFNVPPEQKSFAELFYRKATACLLTHPAQQRRENLAVAFRQARCRAGRQGLAHAARGVAAGTRILTPAGDVPVEELSVGDTVITVREGGPMMRKIIWTGQQRIHLARQPEPDLLRPVRISAGALGDGVLERDLRLSPHHAVYLDGLLFEAISLVNGTTICQEQGTGWVSYHHIELDEHDILLAEGCACESYLDTGSRHLFGLELFPDFRGRAGAAFCVTLIRDGAALSAARGAINARAAAFFRAA